MYIMPKTRETVTSCTRKMRSDRANNWKGVTASLTVFSLLEGRALRAAPGQVSSS